jgi:hypothetical protein
MSLFIDRTGQQFGYLTVIGRAPNGKRGTAMFYCRCKCGRETIVKSGALKGGNTRSCGCLNKEVVSKMTIKRNTTHGMAKRKDRKQAYITWAHIKERCENPSCRDYKNYGGRGIAVCDSWQIFENFYNSMGDPPTSKHTIERVNNNKNYEPDNCIWATRKEQNNNTRLNRILELNGQRKTLAQWSESTGINHKTLSTRLRDGWSVERALTQKVTSIPTEAC